MENFALGLNLLFRVITEHIGWYDMKYFICEMTSVLLVGHSLTTARSIEIVPRGGPSFWMMGSLFG